VHRAEILRLRGTCDEAEREAVLACDELRPYLRREMGWPLSELGRIRLRKGDVDGAEESRLRPDLRQTEPTSARLGLDLHEAGSEELHRSHPRAYLLFVHLGSDVDLE
jgi:hypothetical protein